MKHREDLSASLDVDVNHHTESSSEQDIVSESEVTAKVTTKDLSEFQMQKKLLEEILTRISSLDSGFSSFQESIEKGLSYDKAKEEAFNHLYRELDEFKKNAEFEKNKPLYIDLILLFDRIDSIRGDIFRQESISIKNASQLLRTLQDELVEILYRRGIEIVESSSQDFNRTFQRAISTESTTLESENNRVARIIRRGFRHQSGLLRPEEVVVKKYQ